MSIVSNLGDGDSGIWLKFMELSLLHSVRFKLPSECACIIQPYLAFSMKEYICPLPWVPLASTHITLLCQWIHILFVTLWAELRPEPFIAWPAILHYAILPAISTSLDACKWSLEFAINEESDTLERAPVIFAVRVNELNLGGTVGDSVVESAQFQCDFVIRNLLDWSNRVVLIIGMHHCPLEICLELKSVVFEVVDVLVEREAFSHWLLRLTIFLLALFKLFFVN